MLILHSIFFSSLGLFVSDIWGTSPFIPPLNYKTIMEMALNPFEVVDLPTFFQFRPLPHV
jgi:hypothetical protein